ncbi:MAG TPA: hypothetical protein VGN37_20650 [Actinocatenispora sp.]
MGDIDRLIELVGRHRPVDRQIDWPGVEDGLGVLLPSDYKTYIEAFPPGAFQEELITISHPGLFWTAEKFVDDVNLFCRRIEELKDYVAVNLSYRMHPARDGLLPWGFVGVDFVLCWQKNTGSPDTWSSVIASPNFAEDEIWHIPKGMLATLIDLISGNTGFDDLEYLSEITNFGRRNGY